jgi:membrane protease YdiL (CAAX protease family)
MNHLERALDNQNQWWKYLVMFLITFIATNLIGAIPLVVVIALKTVSSGPVTPNPDNIADFSVYGISPNLSLVLLIFPFLVGLLSLILFLKPFHKRNYKEVINGTKTVRWNRFFTGAMFWILLMGIYLLAFYLIDRDNFQLQFNPNAFFTLIAISLLLIPFQTTYEELFFRGYLAQGIGAWTRNRWMVLIIPAIMFGLLHAFNPEVKEFGFWVTMPQYWLFGLFFGLLTILDDGIEIAMGVHAANNIFTSVMVTHSASVLQTPALLNQIKVEPLLDTFLFLIIGIVFIIILRNKYKWNFKVMNLKIQKEESNSYLPKDV